MIKNKIKEIEDAIGVCYDNLKTEKRTYSTNYLCEHYDESKEVREFAKKTHTEAIHTIIGLINELIDYPVQRWLIFEHQDRASFKIYNHNWTGEFVGYKINIPQIDKQEYYCIIRMFNKNKCWQRYLTHENQWVIRNDI